MDSRNAVVLFDFASTLASIRIPADGRPVRARIYPGVTRVLDCLRSVGVRLGMVSLDPRLCLSELGASLTEAGISTLFDPDLVLCAPNLPAALVSAGARAPARTGYPGELEMLFVSGDVVQRMTARASGLRTAPHPLLALSMISQVGSLRYLRIRFLPAGRREADWRATLRGFPLVPLHMVREPGGAGKVQVLYAIADATTAANLDDLGFWVDRLGAEDEPQSSVLYLLKDNLRRNDGLFGRRGSSSAFFAHPYTASRVLASTHEGLVVALPGYWDVGRFNARQGDALRLMESSSLLDARDCSLAFAVITHAKAGVDDLTDEEVATIKSAANARFIKTVAAQYSGDAPLSTGERIRSRDVHNEGNGHATDALKQDLHDIYPDLAVNGLPCPPETVNVVNVEGVIPGTGLSGIVLVCAHVDSIGIEQTPYDPKTSVAPGADDDASGIAGVFAVLQAVVGLFPFRPHRREIRFVLFNSEEQGFLGSGRYVSDLAAQHAVVAAAFQMDMIAYDAKDEPIFELHVGASDHPEAERCSLEIAELVVSVVKRMNLQIRPQVHRTTLDGPDPGEERSDHLHFHRHDYPACYICEDFFPTPGADDADKNPGYHNKTDTIDLYNAPYAAEIAQAVAGAVWLAATAPEFP